MEKKIYLNNTTLEDLESIKNDIKNLNDFYSKTLKTQKNENKPISNKEINENLSKQKEDQKKKSLQ